MQRREFIGLIGGGAAWPLSAKAQVPNKRPLIVWFGSGVKARVGRFVGALQEGLQELGYTEGRNIDFAILMAENEPARLPDLAKEVVGLKPAVICASASDTALAAKKVTSTIPIVSGTLADAVHLGLVASFARPGGNVTGIMPYIDGLPSKQIELAREVLPGVTKIGLLGNISEAKVGPQFVELREKARTLGFSVVVPEFNSSDDLSGAIQKLSNEKVGLVIVLQSTMLLSLRQQIASLMAASRLPAVYGYREHVDEGGLISYGIDLRWCWHRAATYVHKVLAGANPADLPVEFPSKIQLVVNLKTAKELEVTIPPALMAGADEVIE